MSSRSRRGVTLIEMVVVLGIVAIIAMVAIPTFGKVRREQKLRSECRKIYATIRQTQNAIATGKDLAAYLPPPASGQPPPTTTRAKAGGIIVQSTSYSTYLDIDDNPSSGNEVTLKTVDFTLDTDEPVGIALPSPGTRIQLRSNGTLNGGAAVPIELTDPSTGAVCRIEVSVTGGARIL
jgi:prepilin-type N-terminal cleavage/methylation domain-containing protein